MEFHVRTVLLKIPQRPFESCVRKGTRTLRTGRNKKLVLGFVLQPVLLKIQNPTCNEFPVPPSTLPTSYQVLPYSRLEPITLFVYSISAASVCVMLM